MNITETPEMRARINFLYQKSGGNLTAEQVVEDAKSASSPLHKFFEWNLRKAAEKHWFDTARALIRAVRVDIIKEDRTVEAIAYIKNPGSKSGYVSITKLQSDQDSALEALKTEFQRIADTLRRAREIATALGLE